MVGGDVPGTTTPTRGSTTDQPTAVAPSNETIVDASAEAVRKRPRETAAAVAAGTFATPAPVDDPVGAAIAGGLLATAVGSEIARREPEVPIPEGPVLEAPELPVTGEALPGAQSELSPTDALRQSAPELPATGDGGPTATRLDPSESPVVDRPEVPLAPTGTGTETAPGLSFGRDQRTIQITKEVEEGEEEDDRSVVEDRRFSAFDREGVGRNIGRARTNPEDRANPNADTAEERLPPREAFPSEERFQQALQRRKEEIRRERQERTEEPTDAVVTGAGATEATGEAAEEPSIAEEVVASGTAETVDELAAEAGQFGAPSDGDAATGTATVAASEERARLGELLSQAGEQESPAATIDASDDRSRQVTADDLLGDTGTPPVSDTPTAPPTQTSPPVSPPTSPPPTSSPPTSPPTSRPPRGPPTSPPTAPPTTGPPNSDPPNNRRERPDPDLDLGTADRDDDDPEFVLDELQFVRSVPGGRRLLFDGDRRVGDGLDLFDRDGGLFD